MNINPVLVATLYDSIGGEPMDFVIKDESQVNSIIEEYNATGEYNLSLVKMFTDYEYTA